jgi:LuxR family maltose regulon positive regulatory protein
VFRSHLIERLQEGAQRKLTLLSAPAGFGKTTLVADWIALCKPSIAWVSLDKGDNEPARFWSYVAAALQPFHPTLGKSVYLLFQVPQLPSNEALIITLINALSDLPLVLEDYHVIDAPAIHESLTFLLEHLPRQLHVIMLSRTDPPLALARLRARGQMIEVRASDLRFTIEEATTFLQQVMGLTLSTEEILALEMRTEGWIVGLQFAALSLQGQKNAC